MRVDIVRDPNLSETNNAGKKNFKENELPEFTQKGRYHTGGEITRAQVQTRDKRCWPPSNCAAIRPAKNPEPESSASKLNCAAITAKRSNCTTFGLAGSAQDSNLHPEVSMFPVSPTMADILPCPRLLFSVEEGVHEHTASDTPGAFCSRLEQVTLQPTRAGPIKKP